MLYFALSLTAITDAKIFGWSLTFEQVILFEVVKNGKRK